jgi:hypothetical protein
MRLIVLLSLLLFLETPAQAHPLHLSITNITYENGKLLITMKTFRDDWELAYYHYHGKLIDFTDSTKRALPWFNSYLKKQFRISGEKGKADIELEIGPVSLEEDAMTIEMSGILSSKPNSLYIYNALLTDIYPDQTNLVMFGIGKKETGIKFDVRKHDAEVILE